MARGRPRRQQRAIARDRPHRASSGTVGEGSKRAWAAAGVAALAVAAASHGPAAARRRHRRYVQRPLGARLVLTTRAYRLTLSKRNGKILGLVDRATRNGARLELEPLPVGGAAGEQPAYVGGCSFAPSGPRRFSYRWSRATSTLTLAYRGSTLRMAVVTLRAARPFDLRLRIENRGRALSRVEFPEALAGDTAVVTAGYAPTVLPGVRLAPAFFSRVGDDVQLYPSRWAFADYLALDAGGGHLSVYSVRAGRCTRCSSAFSMLPSRHRAPGRRTASSTSSRRGSSAARRGRARSSASASARRRSSRSSPTGTTTGSMRIRRCRASSALASRRTQRRRC